MAQSIQHVGAVHARNDMEGVQTPGAFTTFDDDTAVFCGNGSVTAGQATAHYISFLAKSDPAFKPFDGEAQAGTFGARLMLQKNQHLKGLTPEKPVPEGELFQMDGASLKAVLAPFASRLDELRAFVAQSSSAGGGIESTDEMARVTGNVRTQGRNLPTI